MTTYDVHAHALVPAALEEMASAFPEHGPSLFEEEGITYLQYPGRARLGPLPRGIFDPETRIEEMDGQRVDTQVIAIAPPNYFYHVPAEVGAATVRMDTPAGRITAWARTSAGRVDSVRFQNVPSFVVDLDLEVEVPGIGGVRYDLAFGGAFYAFVQAAELGLGCGPDDFRSLIETGVAIKRAITESRRIVHPREEDLGFLYGVIFIGEPWSSGTHSRNVCVFADGEVDRSPTGTGVSGRLAIHHARGEVAIDQPIVIESILGSRFTGRVVRETTCGPYPAVIPEVKGSAFITGRHEFFLDPRDEIGQGFLLR